MSLQLSTLPHLRVGWQKVCDQYNTIAYVTQLDGSAGCACYTNRSVAEAVGTIIETLAPAEWVSSCQPCTSNRSASGATTVQSKPLSLASQS
jgi:hypothetical protein